MTDEAPHLPAPTPPSADRRPVLPATLRGPAARWTGIGAGALGGATLFADGHVVWGTVVAGVVTVVLGCKPTLIWIEGRVWRQCDAEQNEQARENIAAITAIPSELLTRADRARLYFHAIAGAQAARPAPAHTKRDSRPRPRRNHNRRRSASRRGR